MSQPTFRVFVSSTWLDLRREREAVEAVINQMRETKFVGMEYFGSRDETTRRASLDEVNRSEVYVAILAARYGSGITEDEYRRARSRRLPCFIYLKSGATVTDDERETDADKAARLSALKEELRREHTVKEFDSPEALSTLVVSDLHRWLFDRYLTPKLEGALSGETPRAEAQTLLDAIKDVRGLKHDLLIRLQSEHFNVASGGRSVAFSGEAQQVSINTGDTNIFNAPAPAFSPQHQLRAPVGDFVGREKEIEALMNALRGGGSAAITGISGMGGIGKTELALLVADRLRPDYPDAQLLVDMRGTDDKPRDPADALAACVRAFVSLEAKLPESLEDLTKLYRDALAGKRALILLDNASDSSQVRSLLPPPGVALLVTSRNVVSLPRMMRVTLDQLPPTEARELLTSIAPRVPSDIIDQICFLCGYLPLAIRAAGSLLDITVDLDPADYAAQLRNEHERLKLIGTEGVDIGVEASFNLSYQRLHPEAARVFRQLSVFPATFDAAAEEFVCEDEYHKHLSDLLRRSLVLYDDATARYRLHDLARLFADTRIGVEELSAGQVRHATHYLSVLWEIDKLYKQGGQAFNRGLALFDLEWRNIQTGQTWAKEQSDRNDTAARLCSDYPNAGSYPLDLRQHPRERILWREAALTAARRLKNRAAEGVHLGSLGIVYVNLGETDRALVFQEQHLAITREMGDRRGEGQALGNLGNIYFMLGNTSGAIEFYEQSLVIFREIGDRWAEGHVLSGLGNVYRRLGDVRRAIGFHEQALAIDREIGDRLGESKDLGNLGNAYRDLGETLRAVELYRQTLIITREIGDRLGEGGALFNNSLALYQLGDRAQAIAHAEEALEIFEQIESPYAASARAALDEWRGQAGPGEGDG